MKKFISIAMSLVMILAFTATASAEDTMEVYHMHKHSPCNELSIDKPYYISNDSSNNFALVKKGGEYYLWTYDELSDELLKSLQNAINNFEPLEDCSECEKCGYIGKSLDINNTQYHYGTDTTFEIGKDTIVIKPMFGSDSCYIEFSDPSNWSLFYLGEYYITHVQEEEPPADETPEDEDPNTEAPKEDEPTSKPDVPPDKPKDKPDDKPHKPMLEITGRDEDEEPIKPIPIIHYNPSTGVNEVIFNFACLARIMLK